ncbi:MAG: hypothetical protein KBS95_01170 [Alistipes sp.]|nr:hypothetical protein [Candidatus Alistipes equi]
MKRIILSVLLCAALSVTYAQKMPENSDDRVYCYETSPGRRTVIQIPDIDQYRTFKCDFHLHTVFADAQLSPEGRVREAWHDGLDVIAMTEHVGVHKTKGIKLKDYNLPPKLAQQAAKAYGLIVIKGAEVTRTKPFGHMNMLFLEDCNVFSEHRYLKDANGQYLKSETGTKVSNPETEKADFEAAEKQGAFIIWNHPGWPDKKCTMYDLQKKLIEEHRIHAVELCNHNEWYPKVLDWFDQYHLPMMANSDQHNPTSYDYGMSMRPMTLVFAKEYTEQSIKEAMFAGRMVAFFNQTLAGEATYIEQLIHHSLSVRVLDEKTGRLEVTNNSDIPFKTLYGSHMNPVIFHPHKAILVSIKKGQKINFINCYVGRNTLKVALW